LEAGVEPSNASQRAAKSGHWLWSNLPSSQISLGLQEKILSTEDSDFLGSDATKTCLILWDWHQAQQPPTNRFKIGKSVVEISAIKYNIASLIPDTPCREESNLMAFDSTGTYLIPLPSWRQAQGSPAIRFRIGAVVVEGSAIGL